MSFDLSRIRFDARRDFLGVVMQQGRVQLDADWNDWVAQLVRRLQTGALDTFTDNVVPRTTPDGFLISLASGVMSIGPGRMYVDGVLAENHGAQPDTWDTRLAERVGSNALAYTGQPYYPNPPALPEAGKCLVYLDVWQRDVTAVVDPGLVEQAVGVDTTGRLQTVWQVKYLSDVGDITCATDDDSVVGWEAVIAPSPARLSTDTGVPTFEPEPCQIPPAAGYRGLENQLYRIEVHTGGPLGTATFKWSRDNLTVASRVSAINPALDRITVDSIGRDDVLRFHDGDWVEVIDDWLELQNLPGELRRIRTAGGVDETARTLEFDLALTAGLFPVDAQQVPDATRNTRVRRWDQSGQVRKEDGSVVLDLDTAGATGDILIPATGTRLFLENGILVDFSLDAAGSVFVSGDHWAVAARSVDASLDKLLRAPPLGIHHHYARLAVVEFPGTVSDCRTLWPPIAAGTDCDCSLCVSAEDHNSGTLTLQKAVDTLKDRGGTLCLGIGTYKMDAPLVIDTARSLRIRGQGWATLLVGGKPGAVIEIDRSTGVALQNLSVIGSAAGGGYTPVIFASNTLDLHAEHINVLGMAVGDGQSQGIGLSGFMLGTRIHDCALVAQRGLGLLPARDRSYLLSAELSVTRNLFFSRQSAVQFDGLSLHYGTTRLDANLMINGDQSALVATGAVLPGARIDIVGNVIHSSGTGIRAGVDGLCIRDNDLSGEGERSGDGIVLEKGLDPVAINNLMILDNRLRGFQGNAISVSHRLENARIAGNCIEGIGLGALVMGGGASAGVLAVTANQCRNLGLIANDDGKTFAALQLVRVEHGDVCENVVSQVARSANALALLDCVRGVALGRLRIAGNRLFAIGPDRGSGEMSAVHLGPPFERVVIDENHIDRVAPGGAQKPVVAVWRAINIGAATQGTSNHYTPAHYIAAGDFSYLLTSTHAFAVAARPSDLSVQGNNLRVDQNAAPFNLVTGVDHLLFAGNRCEAVAARTPPQIGDFAARTLTVSNNRLVGTGDIATLNLTPGLKRAIVMGNTSTGAISVQGDPLPTDLSLTNLFGS